MRHPVEFRDRVEVVNPCLLRPNKYLPPWRQFISLAHRSKPHVVGFWPIVNRCRIERRPAMRAETLHTNVSTVGGLSIFCRFAGQEYERAWASDDYRSQWSAAHCLAVCTVANGRGFGIGFGLESHVTAVAASINLHGSSPDNCEADHQHRRLLRPRRDRPRRRASKQRDELAAPDHSITSSARASSE